jgi:acetyltransferase-like isoleucine patch superfamily enzyme
MRIAHDWWPVDLPDNVVLETGAYVDSAYSFHHYRSTRPCGLRMGAHSSMYQEVSFELGPAGEVDVGEYTMLYGGKFSANSRIEIGSYTLISYETYLADDFAPVPPTDRAYPTRAEGDDPDKATISIGDVCWIGLRATILAPASLGTGVIVAAGALVDFEVPDYAVVAGNPGRIVGWARPTDGSASIQTP